MNATNPSVIDMTRGPYFKVYSGFLRGRRINKVTDRAEHWFWRLYALADDFGNLRADKDTLYRDASPKRSVTKAQCERWLKMLADEELISIYWLEDERYIHINDYTDLQPASKNGRRIHRVKPQDAGTRPGTVQSDARLGTGTRPGNATKKKPAPDPAAVNPGESGESKKSKTHHAHNQAHDHDQPPPAPPRPAPDPAAGAAAARVLRAIGVSARVAREFSDVPADTVIRHWLTLENAKRPAGALVSRLRDGAPPATQPTPKAIADACRSGVIQAITLDGKTLDVQGLEAGSNSRGVVIGKHTLPPDRIGEAVFA